MAIRSHCLGVQIPKEEQGSARIILVTGVMASGKLGPFRVKEDPGLESVIICAATTMCDTSCHISFGDGKIRKSEFHDL